jgi:hypothetical protein
LLHRHRPATPGNARQHLGELIAELADPWTAQHQATLAHRHGHPRRRAAGAGPTSAGLVRPGAGHPDRGAIVLRLQLPHQALAVLLGVDRATITLAIGQIRPLLAARGFAVPGQPTLRLRTLPTLADVVAYAAANGVQVRIDRCRRPRSAGPAPTDPAGVRSSPAAQAEHQAHRGQRRPGPHPVAGAVRPRRMHDQTAVKTTVKTAVDTEGIADLLTQHPGVKVRVDEGYRGLAKAFPDQVNAPPPPKPAKDAAAELVAAYRQARTEQSSRRSCVEHPTAEHKHWRSLQRWLGRRES